MLTLLPYREHISRLDHYSKSALVVQLVSVGLLVIFFLSGVPSELILNGCTYSSLLTLFPIPGFIAHMLSSATYIGGTVNLFTETDLAKKEDTKFERWATLIAIVIGLGLGIALAFTIQPLSLFSFLSTIAGTTGTIAGIGSRLGGIARRPLLEQIALGIATLIGVALSLALIITNAPIINIVGIITFATGAPIFPAFVSATLFACLFTSTCMSGADYFSKSVIHLCGLYPNHTKKRYHEYSGSFVGSLFSLFAAYCCTTSLSALAGSALATGGIIFAIATFTVVVGKCFGVDGIWSRFGRTLDGLFDSSDTLVDKVSKVVLVITGIAAFSVIWNQLEVWGNQVKNYLFSPSQPAPTESSVGRLALPPSSSLQPAQAAPSGPSMSPTHALSRIKATPHPSPARLASYPSTRLRANSDASFFKRKASVSSSTTASPARSWTILPSSSTDSMSATGSSPQGLSPASQQSQSLSTSAITSARYEESERALAIFNIHNNRLTRTTSAPELLHLSRSRVSRR